MKTIFKYISIFSIDELLVTEIILYMIFTIADDWWQGFAIATMLILPILYLQIGTIRILQNNGKS